MKELIMPAAVAQKFTISKATQEMWGTACWTVKQAMTRFQKAYKATLDEQLPGWQDTWKTDPLFSKSLGEIEAYIKQICKLNGMQITAFNRYRAAARKSVLLQLPPTFATQNISVQEAVAISEAENPEEAAKQFQKSKSIQVTKKFLESKATVLPLPTEQENPVDYIDLLSVLWQEHLEKVKAKLGEEAAAKIAAQIKPLPPN